MKCGKLRVVVLLALGLYTTGWSLSSAEWRNLHDKTEALLRRGEVAEAEGNMRTLEAGLPKQARQREPLNRKLTALKFKLNAAKKTRKIRQPIASKPAKVPPSVRVEQPVTFPEAEVVAQPRPAIVEQPVTPGQEPEERLEVFERAQSGPSEVMEKLPGEIRREIVKPGSVETFEVVAGPIVETSELSLEKDVRDFASRLNKRMEKYEPSSYSSEAFTELTEYRAVLDQLEKQLKDIAESSIRDKLRDDIDQLYDKIDKWEFEMVISYVQNNANMSNFATMQRTLRQLLARVRSNAAKLAIQRILTEATDYVSLKAVVDAVTLVGVVATPGPSDVPLARSSPSATVIEPDRPSAEVSEQWASKAELTPQPEAAELTGWPEGTFSAFEPKTEGEEGVAQPKPTPQPAAPDLPERTAMPTGSSSPSATVIEPDRPSAEVSEQWVSKLQGSSDALEALKKQYLAKDAPGKLGIDTYKDAVNTLETLRNSLATLQGSLTSVGDQTKQKELGTKRVAVLNSIDETDLQFMEKYLLNELSKATEAMNMENAQRVISAARYRIKSASVVAKLQKYEGLKGVEALKQLIQRSYI